MPKRVGLGFHQPGASWWRFSARIGAASPTRIAWCWIIAARAEHHVGVVKEGSHAQTVLPHLLRLPPGDGAVPRRGRPDPPGARCRSSGGAGGATCNSRRRMTCGGVRPRRGESAGQDRPRRACREQGAGVPACSSIRWHSPAARRNGWGWWPAIWSSPSMAPSCLAISSSTNERTGEGAAPGHLVRARRLCKRALVEIPPGKIGVNHCAMLPGVPSLVCTCAHAGPRGALGRGDCWSRALVLWDDAALCQNPPSPRSRRREDGRVRSSPWPAWPACATDASPTPSPTANRRWTPRSTRAVTALPGSEGDVPYAALIGGRLDLAQRLLRERLIEGAEVQ